MKAFKKVYVTLDQDFIFPAPPQDAASIFQDEFKRFDDKRKAEKKAKKVKEVENEPDLLQD
jgi:hypothetical protein